MAVLKDLLKGIGYIVCKGSDECEVSGVCHDTRDIEYKNVFVCIKGAYHDSHKNVKEAEKMGAAAVIVEEYPDISVNISVIMVNDTREALAVIAANYYGNPAKDIIMIGITGTKGKTTTSYMIEHILSEAGFLMGVIGSNGIRYGGNEYESDNTTPDPVIIWKMLYKMKQSGVQVVAMEVSSQGLKQKRVYGLKFDYGIFCNISRDHIGKNEHPDMNDYINSKALLFKMCRHAVVNSDDKYSERMLKNNTCEKVTYYGGNGYTAKSIRFISSDDFIGTEFIINVPDGKTKEYEVTLNLPGTFNVYNALAAVAVCNEIMYQDESDTRVQVITASLRNLYVDGRCRIINTGMGFSVIVDYAHNEVSLKELLSTLRKYNPGRLICIFGCGGNRSEERRYRMGETAAKYADFTIITSDNPRYENPQNIMNDIETGLLHILSKEDRMYNDKVPGIIPGRYIMIEDRQKAIQYAVNNSLPGDMTVVAGKGHEKWQEISGKKIPFDDISEIEKAILQRKVLYEKNIFK